MIILIFGQPASGKTTLANAIHFRIGLAKKTLLIDGDRWRDVTKNKDYSRQGRINNLKGAFDMALYLEGEGFVPILSFVTPYNELRNYLLDNCKKLMQIYLTYNEDRGRNEYFAKDFEEPTGEYLKIDTSLDSVFDSESKIIDYILR